MGIRKREPISVEKEHRCNAVGIIWYQDSERHRRLFERFINSTNLQFDMTI